MSGESQILTGIFGGSFDPPHIGHSGILKSFFQEVPECKEVFLIPNRQNPLKNEKRTSSETILEMLHIFVSEFRETIRILDLELKRTGPSFTIQTILELKTSYPNRKFLLLIGEDNYSNFHQWKDWKEILNHVHAVFVFRRFSENIPANDHLSGKGRFRFLNNPLIPVSSTDLRISFARSDSASATLKRERLSENILAYIEKNDLYRK